MKFARIRAIASHIPGGRLLNDELVVHFSGWTAEKMEKKLGIVSRPIIEEGRTATDMAVSAGENLLKTGVCKSEEIDFLILCTQSPDYFLPTSACLIQDRLGLPTSCGAFDFNLGCSGYVYGLAIAKSLIEGGMAKNILLLTSETYSRYINPDDRASRPLFGDAASATLVSLDEIDSTDEKNSQMIGPFEFGTDGSGAHMLIVTAGGHRIPCSPETKIVKADLRGNFRSDEQLQMSGPGIFNFAVNVVPELVASLQKNCAERSLEIDTYIFHQANNYMLTRLQELCGLEKARYYINMKERGNTVSSSIPIAMMDAVTDGFLKKGESSLLIGFGVGLSWAGCRIVLPPDVVFYDDTPRD